MSYFLTRSKRLISNLKTEISRNNTKTAVAIIFNEVGTPVFYFFKENQFFFKDIESSADYKQKDISELTWHELFNIKNNLKFISESEECWLNRQKNSFIFSVRKKINNLLYKKNNSQSLES